MTEQSQCLHCRRCKSICARGLCSTCHSKPEVRRIYPGRRYVVYTAKQAKFIAAYWHAMTAREIGMEISRPTQDVVNFVAAHGLPRKLVNRLGRPRTQKTDRKAALDKAARRKGYEDWADYVHDLSVGDAIALGWPMAGSRSAATVLSAVRDAGTLDALGLAAAAPASGRAIRTRMAARDALQSLAKRGLLVRVSRGVYAVAKAAYSDEGGVS